MTTKRQCTKLLRPLLDRHDDLALVNGWLVLKPIDHIVGGVFLDRTSTADDYWPTRFACHLFAFFDTDRIPIACTLRLYKHEEQISFWSHSDLTAPEKLIQVIESDALPFLKTLGSIEAYFQETKNPNHWKPQSPRPHQQIVLQTALGNLDVARNIYQKDLVHLREVETATDDYYRELPQRMHRLGRLLLADDRRGLGDLLREWETRTVERAGLTPIWQPTPFVFEA